MNKERLTVETRANSPNQYVYRTTHYYDTETKKQITVKKEYLGVFTGRDSETNEITYKPKKGTAGVVTFDDELLAMIRTGRIDISGVSQSDLEDLISSLPQSIINQITREEPTLDMNKVHIDEPSISRNMTTISVNLPLTGIGPYLKRRPDPQEKRQLDSRIYFHVLISSDGTPESISVSDGSHAPWREDFSVQNDHHAVVYIDLLRDRDELTNNQRSNEIIGVVVPRYSKKDATGSNDGELHDPFAIFAKHSLSEKDNGETGNNSAFGGSWWELDWGSNEPTPDVSGLLDVESLESIAWSVSRVIMTSVRRYGTTTTVLKDGFIPLSKVLGILSELAWRYSEGTRGGSWIRTCARILNFGN